MKKFENLGKKLSKDEQKKIMAGIGDGGGCITEFGYDCGYPPGAQGCCAGLRCEQNATSTGTICMAPY